MIGEDWWDLESFREQFLVSLASAQLGSSRRFLKERLNQVVSEPLLLTLLVLLYLKILAVVRLARRSEREQQPVWPWFCQALPPHSGTGSWDTSIPLEQS